MIKKKICLISTSAALIVGLGGLCVSDCYEAPVISGYSQSEKKIAIELTHTGKTIKFVMLPNVPKVLNIDALRKKAEKMSCIQGKIDIPINDEPTGNEYSILLFFGSNYLELVRQSQHWLKSTFNFDRPGGYTILGRRSLANESSAKIELATLVFTKKAENIMIKPEMVSSYDEINYATGLLKSLWSKPINQGPTPENYTHFLEQTFEEKVRRLQTGEFAVMCQGFRDLFLHASSGEDRIHVRAVDAYNYAPQIPDLITYSHSTTEVYVGSLKKWVLFDPWLAIIVTKNGVPTGAAELREPKGQESLVVVPLIDHLTRMYKTKDGQVAYNTFEPKNVHLRKFSCGALACSPGYLDYFNTVVVREPQTK
jgi:hypothetical protein